MERETIRHSFVAPRQCIYWEHPERVRGGMEESFELMERYTDESHLRRYLLKCRECGQLYLFEFYESIDWEAGNDPQYSKYVPVGTAEEGRTLATIDPSILQRASPTLCVDFPKDAETPKIYWQGKDAHPV